jgi:hypothetical protein
MMCSRLEPPRPFASIIVSLLSRKGMCADPSARHCHIRKGGCHIRKGMCADPSARHCSTRTSFVNKRLHWGYVNHTHCVHTTGHN